MRQLTVSRSSHGVTDWHPIDRRGTAGDDYLLIVNMENGNGVVDFEFSPQRPENTQADARDAPTIIIQHDVLKDLTESCASTLMVPFQAFRLNVKSYGSGTISATVVQGGIHGN